MVAEICGLDIKKVCVAEQAPHARMIDIRMNEDFDVSTLKFLGEQIIASLLPEDRRLNSWILFFYDTGRKLVYVVRLRDGVIKFEHFEF